MEKKRIWKRVLSSVLALAMVVTSLTLPPREAKAAGNVYDISDVKAGIAPLASVTTTVANQYISGTKALTYGDEVIFKVSVSASARLGIGYGSYGVYFYGNSNIRYCNDLSGINNATNKGRGNTNTSVSGITADTPTRMKLKIEEQDASYMKLTLTIYANDEDATGTVYTIADIPRQTGTEDALYFHAVDTNALFTLASTKEGTYNEMWFGHWSENLGTEGVFGGTVYGLPAGTLTSLDGVAISGNVKFESTNRLHIGSTETLKHGGFWLWKDDGGLHLSPQGIGGDGGDYYAIHGDTWAAIKDTTFLLRLTFDNVGTGWAVGIYVNDTYIQTLTYKGVTTALEPGLLIDIEEGVTVDMTVPAEEYTEMWYGHWSENLGTDSVFNGTVYGLPEGTLSSLDGVAISGNVNFSTTGKMRIGGTESCTHGGFWLWNDGSGLHLSPQGIGGDGGDYYAIHGDTWAAIKDTTFLLRLTFDKVDTGWKVGIYANNTYIQSLTYAGVNTALEPGLLIGIEEGVTVDRYTEMQYGHWGVSEGEVYGTNVYSLTNSSIISSLDSVAISGKVNFSTAGEKIRIGGTESVKHGGFWFWNGDGILHISPQGIGGDGFDQAAIPAELWATLKDTTFLLRLTFNKVETGWEVGIYANGNYIQTLTCPGVNSALTPGLYIGIDPGMTVDMTPPSDSTQVVITEIYNQVKWSGRNELLSDGVAMDQVASGFEFKVEAKGAVTVTADVTADTYFTVYIDGVRQEERYCLTPTQSTMTVAEFATSAEHVIRVVKQTEAQFSQCTVRSIGFNGSLKDKPEKQNLYLEFIGDSITCGYGVLTDTSNENPGIPLYEDATLAFPFVTAELLSADLSVVGCSGMGLTEGFTSFDAKDYYAANSYFRSTETAYDFARVPDYVIINLGTNDVANGATKEQFQDAVKALVTQIRGESGYNAQVPIIWTDGLMLAQVKDWVTETFTELGGADKELYVVTFQEDLNGGGTHPTQAGYEAAANVLADFINTKAYKILTFSDWGLKDGTYSDAARNFALKDESITSLDGYAIEGYVNYHASGSYLKVGGIDSNPHVALQVWATGTNQIALYNHLNGDNGQPVFTLEGFSNSADTKIRLTFNETATNTWTVGFYVNDEYVGEMNLTNSALGTRMLYGGSAISVKSTVSGLDYDNNVNYEEYMTPIWKGTTVYDESVMPLYNQDGSMSPITLAYAIDEIVSVKSADLQTTYTAGTDYTVENGKFVIPSGSAIPVTQYSEYYFDTATGNAYPTTDGGYMYFSEDGWFHDRQIVVTYTHSDTWSRSVPKKQGQNLTNIQEKLANKEPITVAFFGDSITEGANSSAFLKKKPRLETYAELTVEAMRRTYGYEEIYYVNTALGGQTTAWGAENAQTRVAMHEPDLLFIAFGMNDPVTSEADYKASIESIINTVRADNADCDIVLVGTMLPNEEAGNNTYGNQVEFVNVLNTIAGEYSNVAVADMTNMHKSLLEMKSYRDMTGNNVNHPNDFLGRVYAQVLMETLDIRTAGEGYTELSFADWDYFVEYNSLVKGNVYRLSNSVVTSLDGVAISGKVNFATEGVHLRIGGTDAVKHGGFWMWKASNGLHLSPQGIGTATTNADVVVVSGEMWEAVKDTYFDLRVTFDKVDTGWQVGVYVNGVLSNSVTIEGTLTPELYMGIGSGIYVDMVDEDETYQELTFADWDIYDGIVPYPNEHKDYLHQLKYENITNLAGYALTGTIAFDGGYWRIGTHEDSTYHGLQFQVNGSNLQMVNWLDATAPTINLYTFADNEAIASKVPLRIEFESVSSSAMRIHVYVNNSHKRTVDLTIDAQVSGSTVQAGTNLLSSNTNGTMKVYSDKKTYKELTFSDYEGTGGSANVGFLLKNGKIPTGESIYAQKYNWEPNLNGCAITGRIIFGANGRFRFAGTNTGGFHGVEIYSDGTNLRFINHKNFAETNTLPALYSGDDAATREFLIRIEFDEVTDTKLVFTIYLDGIIKQSYVFTNTLADYPFGAALYFNSPDGAISVKSVENAAKVFEDGIYVKDLTKSFVLEKDAVLINGHLRTEYSAGSKVTLGRGIYQMFYKEQMTLDTCDIYAYVQGDLNVDESGVCSAADLVRAKKVLKEQEELSSLGMLAGDFDINGAFDEVDLTMLRTHILSANELVVIQRPAADSTVDLLGDALDSAVAGYTTESWGSIDALNPNQTDIHDTNVVALDWVAIAGATYKVNVSDSKDMSDAVVYETDEAALKLYNLIPGTTYYWKVEAISTNDTIVTSDVMTFTTKDGKIRTIVIDGVPNTRDIGGLTSEDGTKRIKYGMLYRGGKANYITELGESQAALLGVRTELDLRADNGEAVDTKSFGENVNYINIPGVHYALQVEDNWSTLVEELRVFADPSAYPVYFHCSLGRDRTGTLAFLLEALAGVSEDDLMLDYELSRLSYIGSATATNDDLLPNYMNMYNVINTYAGDTFQEKTWNYLKVVGLTETELSMIYDNITEDVVSEEGTGSTEGYERTTLYYGLGEPCSDFPASNSESYVTKEFTAEVAGGFGVSTYRIWLPALAYTRVAEEGSTTAVAGYEIGFLEEDLAKAKEWVAQLKANGVKQILLCQTNFLILDDQPYFILDDGRAVSQKDIRETYGNAYPEGTTAVYADSNAVPEPGTEVYESFLAVQQAYYDMLIDEIPGITHIEAMNEPEGNGAIRRFGSACVHSAWETPDKFTVDELARVCMDYCYAINKGVSGKNVKVLAPALMTVEGREGTYNSSDVLRAFYTYIANAEDKTIDNYFQILNWHPYVHIGGGGDEEKMVIAGVDNWDSWNDGEGMDWVTYQKNLYQIALDAGDYNTPVWFTEFGQTDLDDEEHEKLGYGAYPELEITEEKVATRFSEMLELTASELPFVQTVMAFRIADWKISDDEFTMDNLTEIGEANYGMIESFQNETSADACLKEIGKVYYDIINGAGTDREKLLAVIRKYYNAFKG